MTLDSLPKGLSLCFTLGMISSELRASPIKLPQQLEVEILNMTLLASCLTEFSLACDDYLSGELLVRLIFEGFAKGHISQLKIKWRPMY